MHSSKCTLTIFITLLIIFSGSSSLAADWPMWRHDAARSAVTTEQLPAQLHLQWVHQLAKPKPAWPDNQYKLQFDMSYEPVVSGGKMFVNSMVSDSLTAYDTKTGAEIWRFYADGPIRLAPVAYNSKVYFASDDGYLYCLNAGDGSVLWKFRGGPSDRKILGNDRLIGMWPGRAGLVLYDGKIYFAAGIWPFMGIFLYELDAETGKISWSNTGDGSLFTMQPHLSPAFGSVAPQGYLTVTEKHLFIANRSSPAVYDRKTGELVYFRHSNRDFDKRAKHGGCAITVFDKYFFNGGFFYDIKEGKGLLNMSSIYYRSIKSMVLVDDEAMIGFRKNGDFMAFTLKQESKEDDKPNWKTKELWRARVQPKPDKIFLKAGKRVYGSKKNGVIVAVDIPEANKAAQVSWKGKVGGDVWTMLAANGKLFVVTRKGKIYCFAGTKTTPKSYKYQPKQSIPSQSAWADKAAGILQRAKVSEGYCISLGVGSGQLIDELVKQSKFHIIVVEPDAKKLEAFRRRTDAAGLYGKRVAAILGDPFDFGFPPYMANLIVSEDIAAAGFDPKKAKAEKIFEPLRPYGGVACLPATADSRALMKWLKEAKLEKAGLSEKDGFVMLSRDGSLVGSDDWTHQYAGPAKTMISRDKRVKTPLGLLWFGGPSHEGIMTVHSNGPSPQVAGGRLFAEGQNMIRATDIYTGRLLWEKKIPDIGYHFRYRDYHPGANKIGANYVTLPDAVYVMRTTSCLRLDPATGETVKEFTLPKNSDGQQPLWGSVAVWENLLIATSTPINIRVPWKWDIAILSDLHNYPNSTDAERAVRIGLEERLVTKQQVGMASRKRYLKKRTKNGKEIYELTEISLRLLSKDKPKRLADVPNVKLNAKYAPASAKLIVMDRFSGEVLWSRDAKHYFRHNAIAVADGKVFCIDRIRETKRSYLKRRGLELEEGAVLYTLDAKTGEVLWKKDNDVFGSWLSYSAEYDILLEAEDWTKDRDDTPARRLAAYKADSGEPIWQKEVDAYKAPCLIRGDMIITNGHEGFALNLLNGSRYGSKHPLTGRGIPWSYRREYGCAINVGSENLLVFRSAAAGYFDLENSGGTGNFGGFRSSCTANLIIANGLLNAPDYTRHCVCTYQNQCSLALVHMPEAEMWTFNRLPSGGGSSTRIRQLGLNFGAPGDRYGENKTLWLDYPSIGGRSPSVSVSVEGAQVSYFRKHASMIEGEALTWVAASGVSGIEKLTVRLAKNATEKQSYTVRLYFAEFDGIRKGERIFNVSLQSKLVLENFDIAVAAGGTNRSIVTEFKGVTVKDALQLDVTCPAEQKEKAILSGIEIIAEGQKS